MDHRHRLHLRRTRHPIAFLLFAFFLGFAVVIGAELNAAIQEQWPAPHPRSWWLKAETTDNDVSAEKDATSVSAVSPS